MKERTTKRKIPMEYIVCDLFEQLEVGLTDKFEVVLDKGTLDAMLP